MLRLIRLTTALTRFLASDLAEDLLHGSLLGVVTFLVVLYFLSR